MVKQLIEVFKSRLGQNNELEVQTFDRENVEMRCIFNAPASAELINMLTGTFSSGFPQDYIDFLESCNGAVLFIHPEFGSENILYSLQEVIDLNETDADRIVVAYICDDRIVIDLETWRNGDNDYLLLCESMNAVEYSRKLNCNFETWLERFLLSQGNKYWYWRVEND